MLIQRVSNAGVLLQLDGIKLLLDGFCRGYGPFLATPEQICDRLLTEPPDLLAFTHEHEDHFHAALASEYRKQTLRPIIGPENLPYGTTSRGVAVGGVTIQPVKSRHIGKADADIPHVSYAVQGSRTVWFMGDAVPTQWRELQEKADVVIVPFGYALTDSAWQLTCSLADTVVLVHMPLPENDPDGLWPQVRRVIARHCPVKLYMPQIGEELTLP